MSDLTAQAQRTAMQRTAAVYLAAVLLASLVWPIVAVGVVLAIAVVLLGLLVYNARSADRNLPRRYQLLMVGLVAGCLTVGISSLRTTTQLAQAAVLLLSGLGLVRWGLDRFGGRHAATEEA
jgi:hypothetical protein